MFYLFPVTEGLRLHTRCHSSMCKIGYLTHPQAQGYYYQLSKADYYQSFQKYHDESLFFKKKCQLVAHGIFSALLMTDLWSCGTINKLFRVVFTPPPPLAKVTSVTVVVFLKMSSDCE